MTHARIDNRPLPDEPEDESPVQAWEVGPATEPEMLRTAGKGLGAVQPPDRHGGAKKGISGDPLLDGLAEVKLCALEGDAAILTAEETRAIWRELNRLRRHCFEPAWNLDEC